MKDTETQVWLNHYGPKVARLAEMTTDVKAYLRKREAAYQRIRLAHLEQDQTPPPPTILSGLD